MGDGSRRQEREQRAPPRRKGILKAQASLLPWTPRKGARGWSRGTALQLCHGGHEAPAEPGDEEGASVLQLRHGEEGAGILQLRQVATLGSCGDEPRRRSRMTCSRRSSARSGGPAGAAAPRLRHRSLAHFAMSLHARHRRRHQLARGWKPGGDMDWVGEGLGGRFFLEKYQSNSVYHETLCHIIKYGTHMS